MFPHLFANITLAASILVAPMSAASERQPALTHVAFIPEGSDLNSVRFEKVKTLKIRATAADTESCEDLAAREHRSASAACPQAGAMTSVYEVTYSYSGQPMASDEYGNRHFTFRSTSGPTNCLRRCERPFPATASRSARTWLLPSPSARTTKASRQRPLATSRSGSGPPRRRGPQVLFQAK